MFYNFLLLKRIFTLTTSIGVAKTAANKPAIEEALFIMNYSYLQ
jgi:hypothetical protein